MDHPLVQSLSWWLGLKHNLHLWTLFTDPRHSAPAPKCELPLAQAKQSGLPSGLLFCPCPFLLPHDLLCLQTWFCEARAAHPGFVSSWLNVYPVGLRLSLSFTIITIMMSRFNLFPTRHHLQDRCLRCDCGFPLAPSCDPCRCRNVDTLLPVGTVFHHLLEDATPRSSRIPTRRHLSTHAGLSNHLTPKAFQVVQLELCHRPHIWDPKCLATALPVFQCAFHSSATPPGTISCISAAHLNTLQEASHPWWVEGPGRSLTRNDPSPKGWYVLHFCTLDILLSKGTQIDMST